ncbi:MAG: peptide chain release factor N(5)-glutamine methyltransferase [Bacteroidales bacterium]|nr:peptide chain release factor N(5)-glutamine methyltransferase [Bacteroidales bacterium]
MGINTIKGLKVLFRAKLQHIYPVSETDSIFSLVAEEITGLSRTGQSLMADRALSGQQYERFEEILARLAKCEPVQYILGKAWFYGLCFSVNPGVLIPRQETEVLVDTLINKCPAPDGPVIDIGTGSGCIAIALKKNLPLAQVFALDISEGAIETAKTNAIANNTEINFICDDILNPGIRLDCRFGLIVSNPPYVRGSEKKSMHQNVTGFEPHNALFVPDSDPLLFYRAIAGVSAKYLKPGGMLAVEINEALGESTCALFAGKGYSEVEILKDLNQKERFIIARKYAEGQH